MDKALEKKVLAMVADGLTYSQVAAKVGWTRSRVSGLVFRRTKKSSYRKSIKKRSELFKERYRTDPSFREKMLAYWRKQYANKTSAGLG